MWIKICGIRDMSTAKAVASLRPHAIGLNFFAQTPRVVDETTARDIVECLPAEVEPIGLFVNHPHEEIIRICRDTAIQTVQIHGDETAAALVALQQAAPELNIMRAYRIGTAGLTQLADDMQILNAANVRLRACVVDALVPGSYGGTGKTVAWDQLQRDYDVQNWPPLILAGGLNPHNVARAIRETGCWGVDTASGVESAPAVKDLRKTQEFIEASTTAFRDLVA